MKDDERFPIPVEWITAEASMLASSVAQWTEREVVSKRHALREDIEKLHAPALRSLMAEVGLQDLLWVEEDCEEAATAVTCAVVLEQVGRADTGLGVALANTWALQRTVPPALQPQLSERGALASLVLPGYGAQRAGEAALEVPRSELAARAEPNAAFHGLTAQVEAMADGDEWRLSGKLARPQINGAGASCFGVVCEVDGEPALFAVPGAVKGLTRGEPLLITGLNACQNADLELKNVVLNADHRLTSGAAAYRELLAWLYLGCAATASGGLLACWKILDDWADSRVIKGTGQPFKNNSLIASLLGDFGERVATQRLLVYQLARQLDTADPGSESTFTMATAVTRTVLRNAMDALDHGMELMASAGYSTEWNLERYWRDVKTLATYLTLETAGRTDLARHYFGCRNH